MKTNYIIRRTVVLSPVLVWALACNVESSKPEGKGIGTLDAGAPDASDEDGPETKVPDDGDSGASKPSEPSNLVPSTSDGGDGATSPELDAATKADASPVTDDDAAATAETDAGPMFVPNEPEKVRGFFVVNSDYVSASVSVVDVKGKVLSASLISSADAPAGLSEPLSGDVVPPTSTLTGAEITLLDRKSAVLTWVNLQDASVRAQLNVGPGGFISNPYDYAPYAADKAYVSRYETNFAAGAVEFDDGGDVLIIDPSEPAITGRIDLTGALGDDANDFLPRPDALILTGGYLYASLTVIDADYAKYGSSRLVRIDPLTDEIVGSIIVDGMRNCGEMSVSPDGAQIALACVGDWTDDAVATSGITLIDLTKDELSVVDQFRASDLFDGQIGGVAFASDSTVLFSNTGSFDDGTGDSFGLLDVEDGKLLGEPLVQTTTPYVIGEVRCAPAQQVCAVADAETDEGVLHFIEVTAEGDVGKISQIKSRDGVGSPPRYVGKF